MSAERETADVTEARHMPHMWVRIEVGQHRQDPITQSAGGLGRTGGEIVERGFDLTRRCEGIADAHRSYFAQMARTCSSVANSPRAH